MSDRKAYFGPAEITMAVEMPYKTPEGKDVVQVFLDRPVQPYEILPKATFEKLVSNVPVEDTEFQKKRYDPVMRQFLAVLLEEGIIYCDIPYIMKEIHNRLNTSFERATNYLWTKDDSQFIPGVSELTNRSLIEADVILRDIKNETPATNTTEEKADTKDEGAA